MAVVTSHSEGFLLTRGERLNDPTIAGISKKGNLVCALTATKPDIKGLNGWSTYGQNSAQKRARQITNVTTN
jgi:hypothetical protein